MINKIVNAIRKGLYEALVFDDDSPISYKKSTELGMHQNQEKQALIARWANIDMHAALSHELHVSDMDLLIDDEYSIRQINNGGIATGMDGTPYDDMEFIHIEFAHILDINCVLMGAGWTAYYANEDNISNMTDIYYDNVNMIKQIYPKSYLEKLTGMFFSYDNNMIALVARDGVCTTVSFIMSAHISDDIYNKCKKSNPDIIKETKNDLICKVLSQIKIQPKKFGFMPMRDDNGDLYYETYLIQKSKGQIELYDKFNTKLLKTRQLINDSGNFDINGTDSVSYYMDFNGQRLEIYQFVEPLENQLNKFGWRIKLN